MADTEADFLPDLTALAASPASGDLMYVVDVSDTTESNEGTSKKITITNLFNAPEVSNGLTVTSGSLSIPDAISAPSAVSGQAQIFVDSADGDLKVIFADGTTKTLATDT